MFTFLVLQTQEEALQHLDASPNMAQGFADNPVFKEIHPEDFQNEFYPASFRFLAGSIKDPKPKSRSSFLIFRAERRNGRLAGSVPARTERLEVCPGARRVPEERRARNGPRRVQGGALRKPGHSVGYLL